MQEVGEIEKHWSAACDFWSASSSIRAGTASPAASAPAPVVPDMLKILRPHARNEATDASRWARWNFDGRHKAPGGPSVESQWGRRGVRAAGQASICCQGAAIRREGQAKLAWLLARFRTLTRAQERSETDVTDSVRPRYAISSRPPFSHAYLGIKLTRPSVTRGDFLEECKAHFT